MHCFVTNSLTCDNKLGYLGDGIATCIRQQLETAGIRAVKLSNTVTLKTNCLHVCGTSTTNTVSVAGR